MSFSSGSFTLVAGNPVVTGTTISSTTHNNTESDIATGLTTCLLKDGTQTVTANIPMSTYKFTGLAAGSAAGDSLRWEQVIGLVDAAGDLIIASGADAIQRAGMPFAFMNHSLDWSVASNILTVALKGSNGSDPSATNPVYVAFRNVTAATSTPSIIAVTTAPTITINNTALLGTVNSIPFRLWAVAFNDGGTWRLGIINCVNTGAGAGAGRDVTAITALNAWGIASSTQESDTADSADVFYTDGAAVTNGAYVVLGYATWESGLATAGTWSAAPTRTQLFGPGVPLPGQPVQVRKTVTGAVATGTTTVPFDDTIPQNTEGNQYMTQSITPSSAANILLVEAMGNYGCSAANQALTQSLFQDSTANALACAQKDSTLTTVMYQNSLRHMILSQTTSSTTFNIRCGPNGASTVTFNGAGAARVYGGVLNSYLQVTEIMG